MNTGGWQTFNEDVFEEFFQPYAPDGTIAGEFGGYGLPIHADREIVNKIDPRFVWTVSAFDEEFGISPGFHVANACCFLVTKRPHDFKLIDFSTYKERPFLTEIGRKRQLNRLRKIYSDSEPPEAKDRTPMNYR
tara:strand:+ start:1920 stop:2321 length:402 start_codon:yes stop_codon:yes gene_type:complete